ncbi:hypothetical protein [Thalassoroseus pseudoceratinae]|uniref:hypothetical protein n=1 Tax=Thalassoroseus pseudoceratinae TaxID=2713176 RepID=UPI00142272D3|nr:hypothetical protein [Thalassoroseus pseudoceratinae]
MNQSNELNTGQPTPQPDASEQAVLAAKQTPEFILSHEGELHGVDTPEHRELVRRITACVHACDGISTAELEAGIIADMRKVIAEVLPVLQAQQAAQKKAG